MHRNILAAIVLAGSLVGLAPLWAQDVDRDTIESKWNSALAATLFDNERLETQLAAVAQKYPELAGAYRLTASYAFYAANRDISNPDWGRVGPRWADPCPVPGAWKPGGRCWGLVVDMRLIERLTDLTRFALPFVSCDRLEDQIDQIRVEMAGAETEDELEVLEADWEALERGKIAKACPDNVCEELQAKLDDINSQLADLSTPASDVAGLVAEKLKILGEDMPYWGCEPE